MKVAWKRLIRFVATDGRTLRGEPILPSEDFDLGNVTEADQLKAKIITGDDIFDTTGKTKVTNEEATVKKLLGPLERDDVPVLRCIGLNYAKHSTSTSRPVAHSPPVDLEISTEQYIWLKSLEMLDANNDIVQSRKLDENLRHSPSFSSNPTLACKIMMLQS